MTEDEAKTKWCPFVRYLATFRNDAGKLEAAGCFNRGGADSGLENARCIASECMAWQFNEIEYEDGEPLPFGMTPADPGWEKSGETWYAGPGVTGERRQLWRKPLPRTGYCSLAGKAQP